MLCFVHAALIECFLRSPTISPLLWLQATQSASVQYTDRGHLPYASAPPGSIPHRHLNDFLRITRRSLMIPSSYLPKDRTRIAQGSAKNRPSITRRSHACTMLRHMHAPCCSICMHHATAYVICIPPRCICMHHEVKCELLHHCLPCPTCVPQLHAPPTSACIPLATSPLKAI